MTGEQQLQIKVMGYHTKVMYNNLRMVIAADERDYLGAADHAGILLSLLLECRHILALLKIDCMDNRKLQGYELLGLLTNSAIEWVQDVRNNFERLYAQAHSEVFT